MRIEGHAARLTIYVGETDQVEHRPLYHEIIARAREMGLAGATAIKGFEGYGASTRLHTSRILSLSEDLPVIVVIVDTDERIDAFVPVLDELIHEGLVVREEINVVKYVGRDPGGAV
jgi:uncharacterized protein